MRMLICFFTLSLVAASGAVYAESEEEQARAEPQVATTTPSKAGTLVGKQSPTPAATPQVTRSRPGNVDQTPEQLRTLGTEWLKQCLQDWDAATHMTKKEWQTVCRRVSDERTNALIKQLREQTKEQAQNQAKK